MLNKDNYIDKQIGKYHLVSQLSSYSPISKTYQAERLGLKHSFVALKIFATIHLSQRRRDQFLQEAQLHQRLRHAHLLPLLDAGLDGDVPYLVTEFVAGNTLRDRLLFQPGHFLPLREALDILTQVGQALSYAHQRNVVHAHLKPENIILQEESEVVVTDFTLASVKGMLSSQEACPANTYPYMAPEDFGGWMNKSSDQYALGCIAYELLTGHVPFSAPTFALMKQKHTSEKPVPPTQQNLFLPIALEQVILRAMEKKSADRYPTIQDFVAALRPFTPAHAWKPLGTELARQAEPAVRNPPVRASGPGNPPRDPRPKPVRLASSPRFDRPSPPLAAAAPVNGAPNLVEDVESTPRPDEPLHAGATPAMLQREPGSLAEQPTLTPAEPAHNTAATLIDTPAAEMVALPLHPSLSSARRPGQGLPRRLQQRVHKQTLLVIGSSWLIAIVIITALLYLAFSWSFSAKPAPALTVHKQAQPTPTSATLPSPTPSPTPTPRQIQLPILAGRVTPTPTPIPTASPSPASVSGLSATPANLPVEPNCRPGGKAYICTLTLQLSQSAVNNQQWSVYSSNLSAFFNPSNGTLAPGQQQNVFIYVNAPCPITGTLIFSTAQGSLSVPWSC